MYKRLDNISEKIVKYLNKNFPIQIPMKYKLFEKDKKAKHGKYKGKFQIIGDIKESEKDRVLDNFEMLIKKYGMENRESIKEAIFEEIQNTALIILQKQWMPNSEVEDAIKKIS